MTAYSTHIIALLSGMLRDKVAVRVAFKLLEAQMREGKIVLPLPPELGALPNPSCIEALLPKDRPPTDQEIREAWEKCLGKD
jgi:hypothetical protein